MYSENQTEKNVKRKRRKKKRYLLKFIIILIICTGIYITLRNIDYFAIDGIAVVGNSEITDEEVIKLSEIETGDNLFSVHPWFTERKIMKSNLYIEDVNVNRKLPNEIEIIVKERSGKAQFVKGKNYIVTDNEGMVIEIAKNEQQVTLIEGITVKAADLEDTIEVKETGDFDKAMAIVKAMDSGDLYFKKIKIDGSNVEGYVYDALVCRGRYDNVMECIESGALESVIFDLYQKGTESGVINIGSNNYCSFTE